MLSKKNFTLIFISVLFSTTFGIRSEEFQFSNDPEDNSYEVIADQTILIYRKPPRWWEYGFCVGSLGTAAISGIAALLPRQDDRFDNRDLAKALAVVFGATGTYFLARIAYNHSRSEQPIFILSSEGILTDSNEMHRWNDIVGYGIHKVYSNGGSLFDIELFEWNKSAEYIEFEKKDGSTFKVHLFSWYRSVIGISKYKFCSFVDAFLSQARRKHKS